MAYVKDVEAAQETIARLKNMRAQEEAVVRDRIERWRRHERDWAKLENRERQEWRAFTLRVAPLQREIDAITNLLANVKALEAPSPLIIVR